MFHLFRTVLILLALAAPLLAQYPPTLMYMSRGDRSEGLAAEPKSADAIVLISAVADAKQRPSYGDWPASLRLRFYLPRDERRAQVKVRQLRALTGYDVLDSVAPRSPWLAGVVNEFPWPTDVIARVYDFQVPTSRREAVTKDDWLAGLGVVVGLGDADAPAVRQSLSVAPAALHHSNQTVDVSGYLFTFRTNAPASVTGSVLSAANVDVLSGLRYDATSGSPFTVKWSAGDQPEGWYRLVLNASLAGQPQIVVRFYHKRLLSGAK
jgi:hypothetical protein